MQSLIDSWDKPFSAFFSLQNPRFVNSLEPHHTQLHYLILNVASQTQFFTEPD
jgi:hypothetical protein